MLRSLREKVLLTQEQLAARAGVGVPAVRDIELGRVRTPRSGSVRLLADFTGAPREVGLVLNLMDGDRPHPTVAVSAVAGPAGAKEAAEVQALLEGNGPSSEGR